VEMECGIHRLMSPYITCLVFNITKNHQAILQGNDNFYEDCQRDFYLDLFQFVVFNSQVHLLSFINFGFILTT